MPDNELNATFDAIRTLYEQRILSVVDELRSEGRTFILEPELLNQRGEVVREGVLMSRCRLDIVMLDGGMETIRVDSDRAISFAPFRERIGSTTVEVEPFIWDYAQISVMGMDAAIREQFQLWFEDASAGEAAANDALSYVVHFISDPVVSEGRSACIVDFGSAPVAALANLLKRLASAGFSHIRLGSPS